MASATEVVPKRLTELETVTVRFVGDSGDGMQLVGTQFTNVSAVFGNDISTLPDFPAEIRAPAGTLAGVSGYQIQFSSHDIYTPGDLVDTLVAMNPAALKANLGDLVRGGILIVNEDSFEKPDLVKAGYPSSPLEDESLRGYQLMCVPMTRLTRDGVEGLGLSTREADRCKNFFALGMVFWLYDRPPEPTERWIREKFGKNPSLAEANLRTLKAGYHYGETSEAIAVHYRVPKASLKPGNYRKITGNEATAFGLVTAAKLAGKELFYASYPITPASDILHELARLKNFRVRTFQAEDEIAAVSAACAAAFGGAFAVTGTSGPGLALKSEAIGLAVMTELPLVVIDVQRGGPSTGLPTKTEQADLLQAMFGRNGECPVAIVAPATPAECFTMIQEAFRLAVEYMTPVLFLSDGYLANGAEPWLIPDLKSLLRIQVKHPAPLGNGQPEGDLFADLPTDGHGNGFKPYQRNEKLARPWALPGTPGLEHRIGGLEKQDITGNVSYDPQNHERMVRLRAAKIAGIAKDTPELQVDGPPEGELVVVGWGSTYGAIATAVRSLRQRGKNVAHAHVRYLNPLPRNTADLLRRYRKVLVPEMNLGQLRLLLRGNYLVDCMGLNKVQGKPFLVSEIVQKIEELLKR
ncbi:MAG: 2-oxoacid:acceptor oxidoreductase subunit alpha [Planctomycetes bacterium]|nr:2-oxoacid:acceptor oxidoreductase subunit alpha [Planctomycetota bacterium]